MDGVNYFFKTENEFIAMIDEGKLLEYAKVFDHYYGTPLEYVREKLEAGSDVLLEIDVQGALNVRKVYPDAVLVFIEPPSMEVLEQRLRGRGTEDEQSLELRLADAAGEMEMAREYDERVVNDDLQESCAELLRVLDSHEMN